MRKKVVFLSILITLSIFIVVYAASRVDDETASSKLVVSTDEVSFYQASQETADYPQKAGGAVKNVIFCIGDGMGHSQIALARIAAAGQEGRLYMERLSQVSLVRTHSADSEITDSAAAATALSAGIKTNKGMLGMEPDGDRYQTILEAAKGKGMRTGLVATSSVTHATPAAFAAHVRNRSSRQDIAAQILDNEVNVILGGGRRYFGPPRRSFWRASRPDLITQAIENGYTYIHDSTGLEKAEGPRVLGLFQPDQLETTGAEPSLVELTTKAIEILDQGSEGFFLMVEGSQIDWACHENDARRCIRQMLLFDQAVRAAIDFALEDGRTLVLVTGDHETGGLTIKNWDPQMRQVEVEWSSRGHTSTPVPLYTLGPGAEVFQGVADNTEIPRKIATLLGIDDFPKLLK